MRALNRHHPWAPYTDHRIAGGGRHLEWQPHRL